MESKNETYVDKLIAENYTRLFKYCLSVLHGDEQAAADCICDVFITARLHANGLSVHPDPIGWLYAACRNCLKKARKRRYRLYSKNVSLEQLTEDRLMSTDALIQLDAFTELAALEERQTLSETELELIKLEIVNSLSPEEGSLYRALYEEGSSVKGVSEQLGIPLRTAYLRKTRLEASLRMKAALFVRRL